MKEHICDINKNMLNAWGFKFVFNLFSPSYYEKYHCGINMKINSKTGVICFNDMDGEMTKIFLEFCENNIDAFYQRDYIRVLYRPTTYGIQLAGTGVYPDAEWKEIYILKDDIERLSYFVNSILA